MVRLFPNEKFEEIFIAENMRFTYAISNKGRLVSFADIIKNGRVLNGSLVDGYKIFKYKRVTDGVTLNKHVFFSKMVAEKFLTKTSDEQIFVLHLDRVRDNDDYRNLKWATREEMIAHSRNSPFVIQAKKNLYDFNVKSDGTKLTVTKVMLIKKMLAKPQQKTRLKMIAKQFGVTEMQIRRIKSGENWGYVKI